MKNFICVGLFILIAPLSFSQEIDKSFKILVSGRLCSPQEVLSKYIQFRSYSGNEKEAGEFIRAICEENDLIVTQFGDKNSNFNFAASILPLEKKLPNIILLNHIDVVHEADSIKWQQPPFSGNIRNDTVWGRGAFDNKGPAIMQLFSVLKLKSVMQDSLIFNATFMALSCEENMCNGGADFVIENYLEHLNPVSILGEGATELSEMIQSNGDEAVFGISVGHKRPVWIKLSLKMNSYGHSCITPQEYSIQNMVKALSNLIDKKNKIIFTQENKQLLLSIGNTKKGLTKLLLKHPSLFRPIIAKKLRSKPELLALFTNNITITSIECDNEIINKIPGFTSATLDCRLLPNYSEKKFLKELKDIIKNDNISVELIYKMAKLPVSSSNTIFYQNLEKAIKHTYKNARIFPLILPSSSDIGKFILKGIDCYSILPVELDLNSLKCVHAVNERIPISALYQGIEVYYNFLSLSNNFIK